MTGAGISQYTAKQILLTDKGVLFSLVAAAGSLLASFMGGFVAGYRALGRGWITGFLVGAYLDLSLIGLIAFESGGVTFELALRTMRGHPEVWPTLIMMILILPATVLGGRLGDLTYQSNQSGEDPKRHTLFGIPWWHWAWLLLFLPAMVVSDLLLSGHLLVFGIFLAVLSAIHFRALEVVLAISTFAGLLAVWFGILALWQGLSIHTQLPFARRLGATALGLVLLFGVNFLWGIASSTLQAAIKSLSAAPGQLLQGKSPCDQPSLSGFLLACDRVHVLRLEPVRLRERRCCIPIGPRIRSRAGTDNSLHRDG